MDESVERRTIRSVKQIDETNISREQRSNARLFSLLAGESRGGNTKYIYIRREMTSMRAGVLGPLIERPVERYFFRLNTIDRAQCTGNILKRCDQRTLRGIEQPERD